MVLFWCVWLFLMENFRNLVTPSNDKAYEITAICESFHKCPLEFHIFETHDMNSPTRLCIRLLVPEQHQIMMSVPL